MFSEFNHELATSYTILDPACGIGELLISIANKFNSYNKNISLKLKGFDTNIDYIISAKLNLAGFPNYKVDIQNQDFLETDGVCKEPSNLFSNVLETEYADLIIANPPYVRTQIMGAEKAQESELLFDIYS